MVHGNQVDEDMMMFDEIQKLLKGLKEKRDWQVRSLNTFLPAVKANTTFTFQKSELLHKGYQMTLLFNTVVLNRGAVPTRGPS